MDQNTRPLAFTLLIPCFNNKEGLIRSLESVKYPPDQFAILIIDDGSEEPVKASWFEGRVDAAMSIEILRLPANRGITAALNAGLEAISVGKDVRYVARLDCADICSPRRFYEQVAFLDQHSDVDLVGSWCYFRDPVTGSTYTYRTPTGHNDIRKGMYFKNMFIHPTVMWRVSALEKTRVYPSVFPHAEDYGFFQELLGKGRGAVIPESLVTCEINPKGISIRHRQEQLRSRIKVVRAFGENRWLTAMGVLKLWCLQLVPYRLVLGLKKVIYD
jgi:glycosyltransferase involved in cell wall biosynthesis